MSRSATNAVEFEQPSDLPQLRFVIVGSKQSGKSTFIQYALDKKELPLSRIIWKKVSFNDRVYIVSLVEVQLEQVQVNRPSNNIEWPAALQETQPPRVDGVIVVYSVEAYQPLDQALALLKACSAHDVPSVLALSEFDDCSDRIALRNATIENICLNVPGVEVVKTSLRAPYTYRRCLSFILKSSIIDRKGSSNVRVPPRSRAMSISEMAGDLGAPTSSLNFEKRHVRSQSELAVKSTLSGSKLPPIGIHPVPERLSASELLRCPASFEDNMLVLDANTTRHIKGESAAGRFLTSPIVTATNLVVDVSMDELTSLAIGSSNTYGSGQTDSSSGTNESRGSSFDELVDRLLSLPMTKSDLKFQAIFLCLYRTFAAPSQLLSAVVLRFNSVSFGADQQLLKISTQLRYLATLAHWLQDYPGDFAHFLTRDFLQEFLEEIMSDRVFLATANEIKSMLDTAESDEDTCWACSDTDLVNESKIMNLPRLEVSQELFSETNIGMCEKEAVDEKGPDLVHAKPVSGHSKSTSSASIQSKSLSAAPQTQRSHIDGLQRQAQSLTPRPRVQLTKTQWHQFMEWPESDLARELTRIDWVLYSAIRPRDLLRHVRMSLYQTERPGNKECVDRMIEQFNHTAYWVVNMILLRDKAKHRAKALEKFMAIARRLRQLNNYNTLGAVIAGIKSTAIHRLSQTRELVSLQIQKEFLRLEILMSSQKGHSTYRLAWENTTTERIPYLPLHRRDLLSVEEGNYSSALKEHVAINWKKLETIGDFVFGMLKSQAFPYVFTHHDVNMQGLILDGILVKDDDELYERSVQLEAAAGLAEPRRRFNWFQR